MAKDRSADDDGAQNIAERLIDRVSDAAERVSEAGHAVVEGVEQLTSLVRREEPIQVGQPLPVDVRPVQPKRHGSTWLAWRDNRWVPVHRVKDVGWVWSE